MWVPAVRLACSCSNLFNESSTYFSWEMNISHFDLRHFDFEQPWIEDLTIDLALFLVEEN